MSFNTIIKNAGKAILARGLLALRDMLDPFFHFEEISILAYHSISESTVPSAVPPAQFAEQLAYFAKRGYAFISLADCVRHFERKNKLPKKAVAITFDDGYADFETAALPVLEQFRAPATVFVVGDAITSRAGIGNDITLLSEASIERLRRRPLVTIGYHSKTHPSLAELSHERLQEECAPRYGARYFAYPSGKYGPQATEAIKNAGYEAAFTIKPGLLANVEDRYFFLRNVMTRGLSRADIDLRITKSVMWYRKLQRTSV